MSFITLTDEQERELYRLSRFYWREAERCEKSKAYLAGCVMLGSALETLLILMVNIYPDEAQATGRAPVKKKGVLPLMEWNLAQLLDVAKAAQWLPSNLTLDEPWSTRKAKIGDHAEILRMVRNLAHPARYAVDHERKRVTAKYLQRQFKVALACRDWLAHHNEQQLIEHMKREGTL